MLLELCAENQFLRDRDTKRGTLLSLLVLILVPGTFIPKVSFITASPSMPVISPREQLSHLECVINKVTKIKEHKL